MVKKWMDKKPKDTVASRLSCDTMVFVSDSDRLSLFATCVQAASAVVSVVLQAYSHRHSSRSLPRRDGWRGTVAPRSVAWQALPRQRSAISVVATSARYRATMHVSCHLSTPRHVVSLSRMSPAPLHGSQLAHRLRAQ